MQHLMNQLFGQYAHHYAKRHMTQLRPCVDIVSDMVGDRDVKDAGAVIADTSLLYVHIPFCESLCPYCTFHRFQCDQSLVEQYFATLTQELTLYWAQGFRFTEMYIGGGTPTVSPKHLAQFIDSARRQFPINTVSLETNPNFLTPTHIQFLKSLGIGRLSVGVQSLQNGLLDKMGRLKPYGDADAILEHLAAANAQFQTLNVDMIFNLPGQTADQLQSDLDRLNLLKPSQISWYPLMPSIETQANMGRTMGEFNFDNEQDFYQLIDRNMARQYQPASAWCYGLRNKAQSIDEYIVDHDNYIGIGSGAFSYLDGKLFSSTFSLADYGDRVGANLTGITHSHRLQQREKLQYQLLMKLFSLRVPHSFWMSHYKQTPQQLFLGELQMLTMLGILTLDDTALYLTPYGRYVWVVLMREFFMGVNNFRAQMRKPFLTSKNQG